MSRFHRRFWPLWVAFGCWLLVFLVPATRSGLDTAWSNRFGNSANDFAVATPVDATPEISEWTKRFPGNKKVEIFAASRFGGGAELVKRYPDDATVVALALQQQIGDPKSDRNEGPLTNPNYPALPVVGNNFKASPPANWNRFLALAQRGQKLEPNNSYFSWMRLYGLFATRQDDLARVELAWAARLTTYDDHSREIALNHIAVMRLAYGSPLSPRDQSEVWNTSFSELSRFRQTSRWIMETVIADRQSGRHDRALNSAFHLVKLGRLMRRESYTLIHSMVGTACQAIAINQVRLKVRGVATPRFGAALGSFQSDPRMLYFYAKSQKRRDITRFLDAEWVDLGKWQTGTRTAAGNLFLTSQNPRIFLNIAAERFAVLCVRALPSILVLGALFALVARRFRADVRVRGVFWRGAAFGVALLVWAMLCDAIIVYQSEDDSGMMEFPDKYFGGAGLFASLDWWIHLGLAGAVVCFGLNRAVAWQKARHGGQISLLSRFKTAFEAPEDGLTRFDFGWIFALVARLSMWLVFVGGCFWFCYNQQEIRASWEPFFDMGVVLIGGAVFNSVFLSVIAWRALPRRRDTLRAAPRFIAGALGGTFVAMSVLYALVAFATLPIALQNEAEFEKTMKIGELATARARVGF